MGRPLRHVFDVHRLADLSVHAQPPDTRYIVSGIDGPIEFSIGLSLPFFVILTIVLGFMMSLGKAAVYKHIPVYYPHHVGSVGGLVGMIGGLGGFVLPIAFGAFNDITGVWTSCFMILFVLVGVSTVWMHVAIRRTERKRYPLLVGETQLSDLPEEPFASGSGAANERRHDRPATAD